LEGIIWNFGRKERFDAGSPYSFVVVPGLNSFNGVTKVQLIIEDYLSPQSAKLATEATTSLRKPTPAATSPTSIKPQATTPIAAEPIISEMHTEEEATPQGPQWIDHRSREAVEAFVSQLMLPLQDKRSVIIYHEGKKPDIPFLNESLLCGRLQVRQADELILWDLPPSLPEFKRLLDTVKPEVIHMVGGKYQLVPVFPSEQNYLKLIVQVLRRSGDSQIIELEPFASQLATTVTVITQGLILLEKLTMLETRLVEPNNVQKLQINVLPQNANRDDNIAQRLEYMAFQQALKEVGKFRGWLLKTSLATIKATLCSSLFLHAAELSPERSTSPVEPVPQVIFN
jgi:hypothetical protein